MPDEANAAREGEQEIKHRKNVNYLTGDEVDALLEAYRAFQARRDSKGYGWHAGVHGLPQQKCQHHRRGLPAPLFLPWHRAYLHRFELALQEAGRDQSVTLPWWDWSSDEALENHIPERFARPRIDARGNPLAGAAITGIPRDMVPPGQTLPRRTERVADPAERLPPTAEDYNRAVAAANFHEFSELIEGIHDGIHGWVGGTMGLIEYAAFDPLFWSHHAMIDRLWWIWQQKNPATGGPDDRLREVGLDPFAPLTVQGTLNANSLGYDYALAEQAVDIAPPTGRARTATSKAIPTASVLLPRATTIDVEFGGLSRDTPSYEGRLFVNRPRANDETTPTEANGYIGSFYVFGHAGCIGEEGHCEDRPPLNRFDDRLPSKFARFRRKVDVTEPLKRLLTSKTEFMLTVVPVVRKQPRFVRQDDRRPLDFSRVSMVVYSNVMEIQPSPVE
jgi:tyrosinase